MLGENSQDPPSQADRKIRSFNQDLLCTEYLLHIRGQWPYLLVLSVVGGPHRHDKIPISMGFPYKRHILIPQHNSNQELLVRIRLVEGP